MKSSLIYAFIAFFLSFSIQGFSQTLKEDSLALVNFYNSTGGPSWKNKSNWNTGRLGTWYGITVSGGRVTRIALSGNNLKGIATSALKTLDALTHLYLNTNSISKLDVSSCSNLLLLHAHDNQIDEFVSSPLMGFYSKLSDLRLYGNRFKYIDISNMPSLTMCWLTGMNEIKTNSSFGYYSKLTQFYAHSGGLTSIDISAMPNLTHLQIYSNQLTRLNVSHSGSLFLFYAHNNQIEELVTNTTPNFYSKLSDIRLYSNKLKSIDISNMPSLSICWLTGMNEIKTNPSSGYYSKLIQFYAHSGGLTVIDISAMPSLTHLQLQNNQLSSLDISQLSSLQLLYVYSNQIAEFTTNSSPDFYSRLNDLRAYSNKFKRIDISNMPGLLMCYLAGLNEIKTNPTEHYYSKLTHFYAHSGGLASLNITGMPSLTHLQLQNNRLSSLDISQLSSLQLLYVYSNQIADFTTNNSPDFYSKLNDLRVYSNKFKRIDVSNMPSLSTCYLSGLSEIKTNPAEHYYSKLTQFYAHSGGLTSLNIQGMPSLTHLQLQNNQLSNLDISQLSSLQVLYAYSNEIAEFTTNSSPDFYSKLNDLRVYSNKFKRIDISNMPSLSTCYLSGLSEIKTNSTEDYYSKLTQFYAYSGGLTNVDLFAMPALAILQIHNNALSFGDIEPLILKSFTSFIYYPQTSTNLYFNKNNYSFSVRVGGKNNKYQWRKNGVNIPGATTTNLTVTQADYAANAQYQCVITNTVVTGLTIYSVIKRPQDQFTDFSSAGFTTRTSGNWHDHTIWQLFDGVAFIDAQIGETPNENNAVYLQDGHTITLTLDASCKDLHLNATADVIRLNTGENTLDVYGKIRTYIGTVPGTNSTSVGVPNWITTGSNGRIRLKGTTSRIITEKDEFSDHENLKGWTLECDLAEGVVGTINSNFRAGNIIVTSGNLEVKSKNFRVSN